MNRQQRTPAGGAAGVLTGRIEPVVRQRKAGPPKMWAYAHWVISKPVDKNGKLDKPPFQANGRVHASSSDPNTWLTHDAALQAVHGGNGEWVGFVTHPTNPFTGADFDGCRDPKTGALGFSRSKEGDGVGIWVPAVLDWLQTYSSVSPFRRAFEPGLRGGCPATDTASSATSESSCTRKGST